MTIGAYYDTDGQIQLKAKFCLSSVPHCHRGGVSLARLSFFLLEAKGGTRVPLVLLSFATCLCCCREGGILLVFIAMYRTR